MNLYNEIDPYCCDWLENLIREKLIPDGVVDRRSIVDILPAELRRFTQCHFFAGLGGWPLALRRAAWPDNRKVWTGSCPCQPFSQAGKRAGFADDRHLWPWWRYLIAVCRPEQIFGEQVASAADWLRLVRGDLEALEYAVGCMPVEAASAGADHLRDRFWFVANSESDQCEAGGPAIYAGSRNGTVVYGSSNGVALGDARGAGLAQRERIGGIQREALGASARQDSSDAGHPFDLGNPGFPAGGRFSGTFPRAQAGGGGAGIEPRHLADGFELASAGGDLGFADSTGWSARESSAAVAGYGSAVEPAGDSTSQRGSAELDFQWVLGADGKSRRVKSGIRLLAHGVPSRVAKLRAFGNAIDPRPAALFITASMQALDSPPPL